MSQAIFKFHIPCGGRVFIATLTLCGCVSTHNLNVDGPNAFGGGFIDREILPGFYYLTAIGNVSPWPSFSAAIGTWRLRADQLCGENAYQEIRASVSDGLKGLTTVNIRPGITLDVPKYNTSIGGYILCASSGISHDEAVRYLDDLAADNRRLLISGHRKALEDLGGHCGEAEKETSPEVNYRRGKEFVALDDYKSALTCFLLVHDQAPGTGLDLDACFAIGTMYEMGWGVEKDASTAKAWYKKSGH